MNRSCYADGRRSLAGRVLKVRLAPRSSARGLTNPRVRAPQDDDALSVYKIQSTHTIHMVKGVSRAPGGGSGSTAGAAAAPQQLPVMQTGQNVHDPLTQLNGHLGFGAMAGLNPFGDMGINPNDPNMVRL